MILHGLLIVGEITHFRNNYMVIVSPISYRLTDDVNESSVPILFDHRNTVQFIMHYVAKNKVGH